MIQALTWNLSKKVSAMAVFPDAFKIPKAPLIVYFNQIKSAYFKYILVRAKVEMLPFPNFMYILL